MNLRSINDYKNIKWLSDEERFLKILRENFSYWNELAKVLQEKLDDFCFTASWEVFVEVSDQLLKSLWRDLVNKYFILHWNKLGSRWIGYYWLFWNAYLIENRKKFDKWKKVKESWDSFWKEYKEYINLLDSIKDHTKLNLIYLDNYHNFLLLWIYILLIFKFSNKKKYEFRPIENLAFSMDNKSIAYLDNILNSFINQYEHVLDNYVKIVTNQSWLLNENMNIKQKFNNIKKFMDTCNVSIKKWKKVISKIISSNWSFTNIWFNKIFRNARELDNLSHIFSTLLGRVDLKSLKNKQDIYKIICEEKQKNKIKARNTVYVSAMYWWIEIAMVAKYLGYKAWLVQYSIYHLDQKDSYININDVFFSLSWEKLTNNSKVIILDDNIFSWTTLNKLRTIFMNNHIPVKALVSTKIFLSKKIRDKLKTIPKWFKWYLDIPNFETIKHIALNSIYFLERKEYKGKNGEKWRNINLFNLKKIKVFRKYFWKEFRSL